MPTLSVDQYGSIVHREPEDWLICFVPPIETQWWHFMLGSTWMKHCFAMKQSARGWIVFEPWWSRMMVTDLTWYEAAHFLTWAKRGEVLRVKDHLPGGSSQARIWMSCAALIAHLLGRKYFVWTPKQLYNRLIKEPGVSIVSRAELNKLGAWQETIA